ncbi:hypothetical protein ACN2C6_08185 [Caulobacter sp. ErkDOM-YI]|uniref:hypothetical protein n=1 Tax=unclassified Caulobacter TaxID=2648921 RepID=UPI003AF712F4
MSMSRLFAVAAATALMSGAALAQTTTTTTTPAPVDQAPVNPAAPASMMSDPNMMMMPDHSMMSPKLATTPSASTLGTDTAGVVPMSSQSPEVQATLKAGDPNVVSNAPIADTPENRAKYGKPMSNAGKRSAAKGN